MSKTDNFILFAGLQCLRKNTAAPGTRYALLQLLKHFSSAVLQLQVICHVRDECRFSTAKPVSEKGTSAHVLQ